ncbi:dihydrodipicolinate synthase family protein [Enterovirga rhinocerotis]|uniref:4-hydroxy-tetrahydrodipicolinate synthase n=1 Tax=Enterovirga rhinocerotis TaxID=1339210 RepID=A0A4R7C567_9HYPH|nr:dihydrodipicolinate synthase family protein [Enterovirga rhinocerotis]TDR93012.1 4-hydroxy-tetrahydrodipicolinate synthase [Enterovirga rhinocerotis]
MIALSGLSAFPITPADRHGTVDEAALRRLVARLAAARVDSIGLLGSTGTYAYLTREQRRRALEIALDEAAGAVPIVVGIGALRTDDALRLAEDAKAAGAAAGLLAPVSYTPLLDEEVFVHFETVATESGLPLCIYDNPGTTHFTFSPALIGRLSRVDGILGVKTGAKPKNEVAAQFRALGEAVQPGFSVGCSIDIAAPDALLAGAKAWYSVVGGTLPKATLAITRAAQAGDTAETARLHAGLEPLWECFRRHTSLRVVYALADLLGLCRAEPPRPILPLTGSARDDVAAALKALPADLAQ